MHLNFAGNSLIFGHINRENVPLTFCVNLAGIELLKCTWTHSKQLCVWTQTSWECAQKFFCKPWIRRTSKMRLNSTATSFIIGCKNRENAPITFFTKLARTKLCILHGKQLHFWTQKSWKCAQNFFYKPRKPKTSKMILNLTANSFIFGCINRENAPRTFFKTSSGENVQNASELKNKQLQFWMQKSRKCTHFLFMKLAQEKLLKSVWTSRQTALFLDVKIVKMRPEIFL